METLHYAFTGFAVLALMGFRNLPRMLLWFRLSGSRGSTPPSETPPSTPYREPPPNRCERTEATQGTHAQRMAIGHLWNQRVLPLKAAGLAAVFWGGFELGAAAQVRMRNRFRFKPNLLPAVTQPGQREG